MATPLEQLRQAFQNGDLISCEAIIQRTRRLAGEPSPPFHKLASEVFRQRRNFADALVHDRSLIRCRPNDPIGYYRSGQDLLQLQRPDDAAALLRDGLNQSGDNHDSLHRVALKAYRALGDHTGALIHARALIRLTPDDPLGYVRACQDLITLNQLNEAQHIAESGLRRHLNHHELLRLALQICTHTGNLPAAIHHANQLLNSDSIQGDDYVIAAKAIAVGGDRPRATEIVDAGLKQHPHDLKLLCLGIEIARDTNATNRILDLTDQLLELKPDKVNLIYCRQLLRSAGCRHRALGVSEQILRNSDQDDDRFELVCDYIALGELGTAFDLINQHRLLAREETEILRLTLNDPQPSALRSEVRQLLATSGIYPQLQSTSFNPDPLDLLASAAQKPTIALIHIGKCAGESVLDALRMNFSDEELNLCEFHIFDANQRLDQLFKQIQDTVQIHCLVTTRDPLARWVSAFNWDTHTFHRSQQFFCHPNAVHFHQRYPSAKSLAAGLAKSEQEAINFASFHHLAYGHIAMGADWYLPTTRRSHLNRATSSVIRTERIQQDYESCIRSILNQFTNLSDRQAIAVPKTKQSYQTRYPKHSFSQLTDLTETEQNAIARTIKKDIEAHQDLINILA